MTAQVLVQRHTGTGAQLEFILGDAWLCDPAELAAGQPDAAHRLHEENSDFHARHAGVSSFEFFVDTEDTEGYSHDLAVAEIQAGARRLCARFHLAVSQFVAVAESVCFISNAPQERTSKKTAV